MKRWGRCVVGGHCMGRALGRARFVSLVSVLCIAPLVVGGCGSTPATHPSSPIASPVGTSTRTAAAISSSDDLLAAATRLVPSKVYVRIRDLWARRVGRGSGWMPGFPLRGASPFTAELPKGVTSRLLADGYVFGSAKIGGVTADYVAIRTAKDVGYLLFVDRE